MKKLLAVAAAALLLAGCSSSTDPEPEATTKQVSENLDACEQFAKTTAGMEAAINGRGSTPANEAWEDLRVRFDTASLAAQGDVKERLATLATDWPSFVDAYANESLRAMINERIEAVSRACEADDAAVAASTFVTN